MAHSKKDREAVLSLYAFLRGWGFSVWLDEKSLLPGQAWEREIRKAIDTSTAFLICLSSRWVTSRAFVHKELQLALEVLDTLPGGHIYIIPARLDRCEVPDSLKHLHWVDMFEPDGRDKLLSSVKAAHVAKPTDEIKPSGLSPHPPVGGILSAAYLQRDPKLGTGW